MVWPGYEMFIDRILGTSDYDFSDEIAFHETGSF